MAIYETLHTLGMQTRAVQALSLTLKGQMKEGKRLEYPTLLEDGDIIILGIVPDRCLISDIRCILHNSFVVGATMDIGLVVRTPLGVFESFASIVDGIVLSSPAGSTIVLPIPTVDNINPDGTPYVGINGSMFTGREPVEVAIRFNTTTPLPTLEDGRIRTILSYIDLDSKTGEYTR